MSPRPHSPWDFVPVASSSSHAPWFRRHRADDFMVVAIELRRSRGLSLDPTLDTHLLWLAATVGRLFVPASNPMPLERVLLPRCSIKFGKGVDQMKRRKPLSYYCIA